MKKFAFVLLLLLGGLKQCTAPLYKEIELQNLPFEIEIELYNRCFDNLGFTGSDYYDLESDNSGICLFIGTNLNNDEIFYTYGSDKNSKIIDYNYSHSYQEVVTRIKLDFEEKGNVNDISVRFNLYGYPVYIDNILTENPLDIPLFYYFEFELIEGNRTIVYVDARDLDILYYIEGPEQSFLNVSIEEIISTLQIN